MANSNKLTVTLRTLAGQAAKIALLVAAATIDPTGTAVAAIRSALDIISKAKSTRAAIKKSAAMAVTASVGAYEDDQDKVDLTFIDTNGSYTTFKIPAPKSAIFTDGVNVDLTNSLVIAFRDWVLSNAKSKAGATFTALVRGRRIRLAAGGRA